MEYFVKSIIPIIESKYSSFTHVERNIAEFFLKNQKKLDFSAQNIAREIFVSEASLSRFAKKCGFRGYREFIYQYEKTFAEKSEFDDHSIKMVLNTYQELLQKTYSLVDEAQIARVVDYLYDADRVVVCGKGSSGLAANEMEIRFMRVGVNIDSLDDTDRMRIEGVFQNERSMVCGLTISGETEEVLYLLKEAHMRGARTVIFTANAKDDYADFCDEVILVASLEYLNRGNIISPQFPLLVTMDMLYNNYINSERNQKKGIYDDTLRALKL